MGNQKSMVAIKSSCCVFFILFLVAAFSKKVLDPGLFDEHTVQVPWATCSDDLIHLKKEVENRDFTLSLASSDSTNKITSDIRLLARAGIQSLINDHQPSLKGESLHCLRKKYLQLHVSGEKDDSKILRVLLQHISVAPSPSPAVDSPTPSLTPSHEPSLAPSDIRRPAILPGTIVAPSPAHTGPKFPWLQPPAFDLNLPPPAPYISPSPLSGNKQQKNKHSSKKTVVLSVVLIALVTLIAAAMFFFCCRRFKKTGQNRQNVQRPLFKLSTINHSIGSTYHSIGNPVNGVKPVIQSSNNNTSVQNSQAIGGSPFELPPPPGSVGLGTIPSGMPPLKPPPGRLNSLPPEQHSIGPFHNAAAGAGASAPSPPAAPQQPGLGAAPRPGPPPPPAGTKVGPPPPPPPKGGVPPPPPKGGVPPPPPKGGVPPPPPKSGVPPPPPKGGISPRPPPHSRRKAKENAEAGTENEAGASKTKLKPFFWDKVQANNPDHSMVWDHVKSGSFQFSEEMIKTLFIYDKNNQQKKGSTSLEASPQYIQIIDKRKAQNLLILLRALNVTMEEVCDALYEGNELPCEFLQTLLKMAPTSDEERKLKQFDGELSQLGPADRFLKTLVDIPFAFKRMEVLHFIVTLKEEFNSTMESLATLEVACNELRSSRLFRKLLEAVLKTGNRMNDGTYRGGAEAFKLDTLLKLSDVKGTDGKTTLLHFVVQEIIRSEGKKTIRQTKESLGLSSIERDDETEDHYSEIGLQVVSNLSNELENVKRAAILDADSITGSAGKLGLGLIKSRDLVEKHLKNLEEYRGFSEMVKSFVESTEDDVTKLLEEEKKIMALVKKTGDYFHGNAGKDEGLRLFVIVRDFLIMLDRVCKEVRDTHKKLTTRTVKQETSRGTSSPGTRTPGTLSPGTHTPISDYRQRLFPAIAERRMCDTSSDEDSS